MVNLRQESKQATVDRVVSAASRLFRDRGFEATTVRDIAGEAGVSLGSVVAVGEKSALLVRIFDSMVAAEQQKPPRASTRSAKTCGARLVNLTRPFVSIFAGQVTLARTYAAILASSKHQSGLFSDLTDELLKSFASAVTERGCTPESQSAAVARALYAAYTGTLFLFSARASDDSDALETELLLTFDTICTCKE